MPASRGIRVRRGTRHAWVRENQGKFVCQCGCAQPIPLKPEHFNVGAPRFLHGHNAKLAPPRAKEAPTQQPCACGCGGLANPGARYIQHHHRRGKSHSPETRAKMSAAQAGPQNHGYGKRATTYKGSTRAGDGYRYLYRPDHPFATKAGYFMEHRLALEDHLRIHQPDSPALAPVAGVPYLRPELEVHHLDGDKLNNVPENLQALTKAEHTRLSDPVRFRKRGRVVRD